MSKVKFNNREAVFFPVLRERVDAYFKNNNKKESGNFALYTKTVVLVLTMALLYILAVFVAMPFWLNLIMWSLMGINIAALGFNVMHDGAHGSYSRKKWVNEVMGHSLNVLGGNVYLWKQKHNICHHTYTNIEGHDDDIDVRPFMRLHKDQKAFWFHKFQHYYGLPMYGMMYFFWVFYRDYYKYFSGKIADHVAMRKMSTAEKFNFWISKIVNAIIFIVVPLLVLDFWTFFIGYMVMAFTTGVVLAVVFQLAHIVDDIEFLDVKEKNEVVKKEWAIHQLHTTVDFAPNSKFLTWMLGGLNFQVEHHLFPKISHIHYPEIRKIVKETCAEFNIQYREFPTMFSAFKSHLHHLKQIGMAS